MARERTQQTPRTPRNAARPVITPDEAAYVEEVGLTYAGMGIPRMAGRVMGWLLISDPPHQSLTQLGEVLQASKGSISTSTRMLLQVGLIKRLSLPGDRRDYVTIPPGYLASLVNTQTERSAMFRRLSEHGLDLLKQTSPDRQARLKEMRVIYAFFEREMPAMLVRLQRELKRT